MSKSRERDYLFPMYQQNGPKISTCDRHSPLHEFSEREAIDYKTLVNPMQPMANRSNLSLVIDLAFSIRLAILG